MHGLNASFTRSPELFVRQHVIQEAGEMETKKLSAGVYDIDFRPNGPKLALFDTASSRYNPGEPLVKAFWLPWESGATIELELDTQAEYLLTAHMGGCQLRIVPAAGGAHTKGTAHSRELEYLR